jgi:hypothetical protein
VGLSIGAASSWPARLSLTAVTRASGSTRREDASRRGGSGRCLLECPSGTSRTAWVDRHSLVLEPGGYRSRCCVGSLFIEHNEIVALSRDQADVAGASSCAASSTLSGPAAAMTTPENNSTARRLSVGLSTQDARTGSAMGARPVRHSCHVKLPRYFSYFCAQPPRLLRLPCPSGEMAHHRPSDGARPRKSRAPYLGA